MLKIICSRPFSNVMLPLFFTGILLATIGCSTTFNPKPPKLQSKSGFLTGELRGIITQEQLLAKIEAGTAPLIVDMRTPDEYEAGHVPGAINIPIQELSQRLDELPENNGNGRNGTIVLYCERGVRSRQGYDVLEDAGFGHIQRLEGDMSAWRQRNRPVAFPTSGEQTVESTHKTNPNSLPINNRVDSSSAISFESQWIVSPNQAIQLIQSGATLLDAQGKGFGRQRFPGATVVSWQQFSQTDPPHRGNLLADDVQLTQRLQAVGVSHDRPIVVFANPPHGWGEDGRIVWMLRTLGHTNAVMVDGGIKALLSARKQSVNSVTANRHGFPGDFVVERLAAQHDRTEPDWDIQQDELQELLTQTLPLLIDTRELREYAGETPYGEQRGGHVPGAIHLYFKELLTEDGFLLPEAELIAKLRSYGLTQDRRAIAYCTGGIRSGWLTAVLVSYGYSVENYAGSMWEWSAAPTDDYPLVQ